MSFGFGVGDFLVVLDLANKVRQKWVDAPQEYESIKNVIKDFGNVLRDIDDLNDRVDLTPEREIDLKNASASCLALLTQCEKLVDTYSSVTSNGTQKSKLRRAWKRLKADPDDVRHLRDRFSAQIQQLNTLQLAINTDLQCEINEGVGDLQQSEAQWKREVVADWYSSRGFADQQTDQLARRHADTGTWFLQHANYQDWRDQTNQVLLCPGIPGSGKSILAATIIDDLLQHFNGQQDVIVVYLYCNFNRQLEQSLDRFLACLVRQLFQERAQLPEEVERLYLKHRDRATRPSVDELKQLLSDLVRDYCRVFIVVDALDEYMNTHHVRDQFLDELFSLQSQNNDNVNVLATSRPIPEITKRFDSWPQVEIRANKGDIERYVDDNILRLPAFTHTNIQLQHEIKRQIADKADGMFLLARLQFDSLHDKVIPRMFHAALSKLKGGSDALHNAYDEALDRIEQQEEGFRDLAYLVLTWITYARRELSLEELQEAIAIWPGMQDINHETDLVSEQAIGSVCAGLVVIDQESRAVRLVHYTTQEYLEKVRSQRLPEGDTKIAQSCWTYLNMNIFDDVHSDWSVDQTSMASNYKLLEYAGENWGSHASESRDTSFIHWIYDTLLDKDRLSFIIRATLAHVLKRKGYEGYTSKLSALDVCACLGLTKVAEKFIVSRQNVQCLNGGVQTPLNYAAGEGQVGMIQLLLAQPETNVNSKDIHGDTALSLAAYTGNIETVQLLLARPEIEVNCVNKWSHTALYDAASMGNTETVRLLLAHPKIEVNIEDGFGKTAFLTAAYWGHSEVVQLLLARSETEVNMRDGNESTALFYAAKRGYVEMVRSLLAHHKIKVNMRDQSGGTALIYAATEGHTEVIRLLLAHPKIKVNRRDRDGIAALSHAAENGHTEVVRLLLAQPEIEVNAKNDDGWTALFQAVTWGHTEVVRLLLAQRGIEANKKGDWGETVFCRAALGGHTEIVQLLLARSEIELNERDVLGRTALVWAADRGHTEVVRLLLAQPEIDLNTKDRAGDTALDGALKEGHTEVVRLLLARSEIETNTNGDSGETVLCRAALGGHTEIVQLLLARSEIELNGKDALGWTALVWAAEQGHTEVVRLLLAQPGIDLNMKNKHGNTALDHAVHRGHAEVVELLSKALQESHPTVA